MPDGTPSRLEFHFVSLNEMFNEVERPRVRVMMLERSRTGRVSVARVQLDEDWYGGRLDFTTTEAGWITSAWELTIPRVAISSTFAKDGIDVMPFTLPLTWTGTTVRVDVP